MANKKKKNVYAEELERIESGNYTSKIFTGDEQLNVPQIEREQSNSIFDNILNFTGLTKELEDGFQWTDIPMTVLNTTQTVFKTSQDIFNNLETGAISNVEGIIDAGANLVSGAFDEQTAKKIREWAQKDFLADSPIRNFTSANPLSGFAKINDAILNGKIGTLNPFDSKAQDEYRERIKEYSVSGDKLDNLEQGVGQLAGQVALNSVGVPWQLTAFASSMGQEMNNAFQNNANYGQALLSGIISGGAEVGSEYIGGGANKLLGMTSLGSKAIEKLGSKIGNKVVQLLVKRGLDMAGEGAEEVVSGYLTAIGQKLTYMSDKEINELYSTDQALEEFINGALISGVANVGGDVLKASTPEGRKRLLNENAFTGMTDNEQKVYDRLINDETKKALDKNDGKKLTKKQINQIEENVREQMSNGRLNLDYIEDTLGFGDRVNYYVNEAENSFARELNEEERRDIENQAREEILDTMGNDYILQESYLQDQLRRNKFEMDMSKVDEKLQDFYQKAIDSGMLNNTRDTHNFVDMLAKIHKDKGIDFDFTNNEKLAESGFALDGKTVNGYITDNGITLNLNSKNALESTVGHEITHVLEGTDMYDELAKSIREYAESKGEYAKRLKEVQDLYKDVENADATKELTADLVGDYLFTNQEFINHLTQNRNLFQKIYDEIKYLVKQVTAGSKEQRKLNKAMKMFEKAYRENSVALASQQASTTQASSIKEAVEAKAQENVELQKKAEKESKFKTIDEAIENDKRKAKFEKISDDLNFFNLDYNDMLAVSSLASKNNVDVSDIDIITNKDGTKTYKINAKKKVETKEDIAPIKEVEPKFNEVVDEDLFTVNLDEVNNQLDKNTYKLGEEIDTFDSPIGNEEDIDDFYFELNNGNTLWMHTPYEFGKNKAGKPDINNQIFHGIEFTIEDVDGNIIDEYKIENEDNVYTKEDIIKAIKHMTYDNSNKVNDGQIDLFGNIHRNNNVQYSLSVGEANTGIDNNGNKLSEQQKEYFKNSKVTDEEGNLITVYHTTTDEISQFNEFNPVGTKGYKFGEQVVNFYTNSKTMSGSYADYDYEMADTKTLKTIDDINDILKNENNKYIKEYKLEKNNTNEKPDYEYVVKNRDSNILFFKNKEDLLKNFKKSFGDYNRYFKINTDVTNKKAKYQYEGYVNITNPYIVDAKEANWDNISEGYNKYDVEHLQTLNSDLKEQLIELAEKSIEYEENATKEVIEYQNKLSEEAQKYGGYFQAEKISKKFKKIQKELWDIQDKYQEVFPNGFFEDSYFTKYGEELLNRVNEETYSYYNPIDVFKAAKSRFDENTLKDIFSEKKTTNSIIKDVLNSNERGTNYDGVIIKNVMDYGSTTEFDDTGAAQDVYVTFNSNQFKAVDNENPTEDADIRYSISQQNDIAPVKNPNLTYGEDIAYQEDIAPTGIDYSIDRDIMDLFHQEIARKGGKKTQLSTPVIAKEKSSLRSGLDTLSTMFVNQNTEIDNLAKESGNKNIKFAGDMLNNYSAKAQNDVAVAQTDNYGNAIGKSVQQLFEPAKAKGLEAAFNDYLINYSNIDRWARGKGSQTPVDVSERLVKNYEEQHPEFKKWGKDVWKFGENVRKNWLEAGMIKQEMYDLLSESYPHYVPYISDTNNFDAAMDKLNELKARPIKRAVGGATELFPVEEALTRYTFAQKRAYRQNELFKQIYNTLQTNPGQRGADVGEGYFTGEEPNLYRDDSGNYITALFDGEEHRIQVSDDLFKALRNDMQTQIKDLENKLSIITKPLQTASNIRRKMLTSWSPSFTITNPLKDIQDAFFNSKHLKGMAKNYIPGIKELWTGSTPEARQFLALYGEGNLMGQFENESGLYDAKKGAKNGKFLKGLSKVNNIMELAPRYAEFKASLQAGESLAESMYNAREITTNFSRGGVITKALNRNGFTFLNASVQGFDKFLRNFSGENGARGIASSLLRAAMLGVAPAVFNELAFGSGDDKDEDYDALPDYIKDNYYIIKLGKNQGEYDDTGNVIKIGGSTFLRIPKGRMLSVFGSAARRTIELAEGEENAFEGYLSNVNNQIGINNPEENNIFSPLIQAYGSKNGTAWYGGDIVPTRLQDKPKNEQYDASTDKFSIWLSNTALGKKMGLSPYKVNYVIDQYTGGIGDILLPMITDEATSNGSLLAPLVDKFTADSITDNKYVSDFYTKNDELKVQANSSEATDDDYLKNEYMKSISKEMSKLYAERRDIQADNSLSKSEKYEKSQAIKEQINKLAKYGLDSYDNISVTGNYAEVGDDMGYYKNAKGNWTPIDQKDIMATESIGLNDREKSTYYGIKNDMYNIDQKYEPKLKTASDEEKTVLNAQKKVDIINSIKNANLPDEAKAKLYDKKYASTETLDAVINCGIDFDSYLDLQAQNFTADKNIYGKTINGSKKNKVYNYINNLNMPYEQKIMLAKLEYKSDDTYNREIIDYLNNDNSISYQDMTEILKAMGFKVDEYGNITWE